MDGISGISFKDEASAFAHPITQLVNHSIALAKVPDKTKIAKLIPLFKKGSKLETKYYVPVSLLFFTKFMKRPLMTKHISSSHRQISYIANNRVSLYRYTSILP